MSRPRVILQCPVCKCVADQVYFRRKDAWRCSFCLSYYSVLPVLPVIVTRCTHDHEHDNDQYDNYDFEYDEHDNYYNDYKFYDLYYYDYKFYDLYINN